MDRRTFLASLTAAEAASAWTPDAQRPPNVVICFVDQLRSFEVGCYGNTVVRTPHMDRLAREGYRFEHAASVNPVCVPARSCLLSGQYSRTCTGELTNVADHDPFPERVRLKDPTIAEAFRDRGYRTAAIGKWHIHPDPLHVGFDYVYMPATIWHNYYGRVYWEADRSEHRRASAGSPHQVDDFGPANVSAIMRRYIARHRNEPFFLYYNIELPHMPIGPGNLPERYQRLYSRDDVPLRPNVWRNGKMAHDEHWFKIYTRWDYVVRNLKGRVPDRPGDALPPGFDLRDLTAHYYGAVTCTDDLVGELMAAIEENGIAGNTIVVLSSDHGENLGSHQMFNKDALIQESVRVPLIFHMGSRWSGQVNRAQVASTIDVAPTLLELAGAQAPAAMQGRSLVPAMNGGSTGRPHAFVETSRRDIGICTPTHTYGLRLERDRRTVNSDPPFFHDHREDPFEQRNLSLTGEQADLASTLRRQLLAWRDDTPWLKVPPSPGIDVK